MSRIIPNENTWLGFVPTLVSKTAPKTTELSTAVNLTPYLMSINASSRGNTVPTPAFDSLFETTIAGTVQASLDADFYRDDEADLAWETLERAATGFFVISRFGGGGMLNSPIAADVVEVWPIQVVSRTMANMSSNTVLSFSVSCSVPSVPVEDAVVAA